jgi:hypothetical protein
MSRPTPAINQNKFCGNCFLNNPCHFCFGQGMIAAVLLQPKKPISSSPVAPGSSDMVKGED